MSKRTLMTLLAALLPLTLLAGACSSNEATADNETPTATVASETEVAAAADDPDLDGIEIDFWHIQATIYGDAITEMVAQFNDSNEWGIVVNEVYKGSYDELNQAIRAALAGGGAPDVAMAYENDTLEYVAAGEIVPLDPFIDHEQYGVSKEEMDGFVDGVLARQRVDAYEGQTLSWPHGNSSQGMYYNADLFAEAGIEGPPADWDVFLEQARQMKANTDAAYAAFGTGKDSLLYNMMRSKGVTPINPEEGTTTFTSAEAVEALELLATLYDEELVYTAEDTEQEFTNLRAASEIGTTARTATKIEQIQDRFEWGVALTPQETDDPITQLWGGNHVLFNSDDEDQHLAAWLFMRWFAGADAQAIYAARTGYSPAVEAALDTDLLSENYQAHPQKKQAFENVFVHARIQPPTAAGNAIDEMVSGVVEEVTLGRLTPQEAAERMDAEAIDLLAQYDA